MNFEVLFLIVGVVFAAPLLLYVVARFISTAYFRSKSEFYKEMTRGDQEQGK